jgi:UDP-3-O-[3-hydroxymyristoyl] glucosamine N-acyltransferase
LPADRVAGYHPPKSCFAPILRGVGWNNLLALQGRKDAPVAATVRELADLIHGEVDGDPELRIDEARILAEAGPGHITFVEHDQHRKAYQACRASAAVVPRAFPGDGRTIIRVDDPLGAFVVLVKHFKGPPISEPRRGVDPRADVHPSAVLGPDASVHPFASIGAGTVVGARCTLYPGAVVGRNCRLGDDVVLYPNAVLYDETILGDRVIVHANAVLGADGFGYRLQNGRHVKVPQLGHVEIGDDVEIGANTTIDRGTFLPTRVGAGTKIDNLVMIAHNCQIGPHNLFASQAGIAGSSSTGAYVVLGGQAGVADHVHIGEGAMIAADTGVHCDIPAGACMLGSPAMPIREQRRIIACIQRLPEMRHDVQRLLRHLDLREAG